MTQKVREIMTSAPVVLGADTPLREVARTMRDQDIGDVLVQDGDGSLRGLVTDRDLVVRGMAEAGDPATQPVGDICSADVAAVRPDDDLDTAIKIMREKAVRRVPVTENGRAVGIVSIGDTAMERDERSALSDISVAKPNT